jgi:biotin carboxyl carrier protein
MTLITVEGKKYRLGVLTGEDPLWAVPVDEKTIALEVLRQPSAQPSTLFMRAGGRVISVSVRGHEDERVYFVEVNGRPLTVNFEQDPPDDTKVESSTVDGPTLVNSPMAGKIASVKASVDSQIEEGQSLMILEAMKMENDIASPRSGTVKELYVKQGDLVKAGDKLCLVI